MNAKSVQSITCMLDTKTKQRNEHGYFLMNIHFYVWDCDSKSIIKRDTGLRCRPNTKLNVQAGSTTHPSDVTHLRHQRGQRNHRLKNDLYALEQLLNGLCKNGCKLSL